MLPVLRAADFPPLAFAPPDRDELLRLDERLTAFLPREELLFFAPRELLVLDFLAELAPPRRELPPLDFFAPERLPREDLPAVDDFLPPLDEREVDIFLPPLFFDAEDLRLDPALFFEDLPDPNPVARFAAPAACETARFALSTFRGLVAAFPASAPMTPPTTAPIGPATLPTTAPAAAPACVFEIAGMSSFPEEEELPDDC